MTTNDYSKLPLQLKDFARFCVWGYRRKKNRQTKVPYNPVTGVSAKANNPSTFGTFTEAVTALERNPKSYAGIGIGLFEDLAGIDIDDCIDADGNLSDLAKDIIQKIGSYTERSPSGTGIHILCRAPGFHYDSLRYYVKNPHNHVEFYVAGSTNRYLTITGDALGDDAVNVRTQEIKELAESHMLRESVPMNWVFPLLDDSEDSDCRTCSLDDDSVLQRMFTAKNGVTIQHLWNGDTSGYSSQSEADLAMCSWLAFYTRKDPEQMDRLFRMSCLYRNKWDEQHGNETYGAMTIRKAIKGTRNIWSPYFRPVAMDNGIESALNFLKRENMIDNPRYNRMDDISAGYLLADYIKPFARPMTNSKDWITYDGVKWDKDDSTSVVEESAKAISRALLIYAGTCDSDRTKDAVSEWANKWGRRANRKTYIQDAATVYPVSRSAFDINPWLLNLNNGTLDLKTLELHDHNPDDLITQIAPVDYCPNLGVSEEWKTFISQIMEPSEEECPQGGKLDCIDVWTLKAEFLQRYMGYCLSGDTKEESLLIMYGPTSRNGKSVCVESIRAVMGSYACSVNADTLLRAKFNRNSSGPSEDIARLAGIRMASVGEIPQGSQLDAARVKLLTGGDSLNARFLQENSFDFIPQFKLLFHTNHLPACSDNSVFDSGRVLVLPFSRHFEPGEQKKDLKRKFKEPEMQSMILNWLIEGYKMYVDNGDKGLAPPEIVKNATMEYRKDNDKVSRFLDEKLTSETNYKTSSEKVYSEYCVWCCINHLIPESSRVFLNKLKAAGITVQQGRPSDGGNPTTVICGYRLKLFEDINEQELEPA